MSLVATALQFAHRGKQVVSGVDATFHAGQLTAIVGPNGAGKTTLLRLLSGELNPVSGSVVINGQALAKLSLAERARQRCVMTQNSQVVFDFTVDEILAMGWIGRWVELQERFAWVVQVCDLEALLGRRFNTLSGGEQQRVQFARALLQIDPLSPVEQARYMLLDEPTSSLDVAHELLVLDLARQAAARNIGVVVVMHDLNLASRFADRLVMLKAGTVVGAGSPQEVLRDELLTATYATPMRVERHQQLNRLVVYS